MSEHQKVKLLRKLITNRKSDISVDDLKEIQSLIPEGLVIDKRGDIPQGATYYEADYLFVSPKGKLLIKNSR